MAKMIISFCLELLKIIKNFKNIPSLLVPQIEHSAALCTLEMLLLIQLSSIAGNAGFGSFDLLGVVAASASAINGGHHPTSAPPPHGSSQDYPYS